MPSTRLSDSPNSARTIRTFSPPSPSRPGPRAVSAAGAVLVMGGCRGLAAAVSRVIAVTLRGRVPVLRAVLGLEGARDVEHREHAEDERLQERHQELQRKQEANGEQNRSDRPDTADQ